eukprot:TRINITY_DN2135_c0_g2_i1.p1 TRINITY_DN2135_c0_g2~~TRINITY_DN2135_c0_g2_i1.p1  ORF type:complete len:279 (-),score=68.21 TRINITY_DN2135_c0_g2_i1:104-940(-)
MLPAPPLSNPTDSLFFAENGPIKHKRHIQTSNDMLGKELKNDGLLISSKKRIEGPQGQGMDLLHDVSSLPVDPTLPVIDRTVLDGKFRGLTRKAKVAPPFVSTPMSEKPLRTLDEELGRRGKAFVKIKQTSLTPPGDYNPKDTIQYYQDFYRHKALMGGTDEPTPTNTTKKPNTSPPKTSPSKIRAKPELNKTRDSPMSSGTLSDKLPDIDIGNEFDNSESSDLGDTKFSNTPSKAVTPNRPKPKSKARLAEDEEDKKMVELLNNWQPLPAKPKPKKR